jgi:hypothetical protein
VPSSSQAAAEAAAAAASPQWRDDDDDEGGGDRFVACARSWPLSGGAGGRGRRRNISIFPGRNQKKCFQGGKGANAPPFCDHFHEQKRGWGFEPHKYLFLQRNLITNAPENADKRRATKKDATYYLL